MGASLTHWRATPGRRKVGRGQRALRSPLLWGGFAERRFCWFVGLRSSVMFRKSLGQEVVKHFGTGLGSVAHIGGDLRAHGAGTRFSLAEAPEVVDCGRRRRDGVGGANLARRRVVLWSAGQQDQHDAQPEGYSQKEKHESRIPRSAYSRSGMHASSQP